MLNKLTGQNVLLTKEDVKMIQNIHSKKHPTASSGDLYAVSEHLNCGNRNRNGRDCTLGADLYES